MCLCVRACVSVSVYVCACVRVYVYLGLVSLVLHWFVRALAHFSSRIQNPSPFHSLTVSCLLLILSNTQIPLADVAMAVVRGGGRLLPNPAEELVSAQNLLRSGEMGLGSRTLGEERLERE